MYTCDIKQYSLLIQLFNIAPILFYHCNSVMQYVQFKWDVNSAAAVGEGCQRSIQKHQSAYREELLKRLGYLLHVITENDNIFYF